jgi:hypothetical protein
MSRVFWCVVVDYCSLGHCKDMTNVSLGGFELDNWTIRDIQCGSATDLGKLVFNSDHPAVLTESGIVHESSTSDYKERLRRASNCKEQVIELPQIGRIEAFTATVSLPDSSSGGRPAHDHDHTFMAFSYRDNTCGPVRVYFGLADVAHSLQLLASGTPAAAIGSFASSLINTQGGGFEALSHSGSWHGNRP